MTNELAITLDNSKYDKTVYDLEVLSDSASNIDHEPESISDTIDGNV
jgi:hypothetical protein